MIRIIESNQRFEKLDNNYKILIEKVIDNYNEIQNSIKDKKITLSDQIRFQDYYDIRLSGEENLEMFLNNCPSVNKENTILYCKYVMEKELDDLFLIINSEEFGLTELLEIMAENNYYENVSYIMDYVSSLLEEYVIEEINNNNPNLLILPNNFEFIMDTINKNKTGSEKTAVIKSLDALNHTLQVSYTDPENSRSIHKVVDNSRDHDIKLTDHSIMLERYSTKKTTKVLFMKLPVHQDNIQILKETLNNYNFENIYFVVGFGDFSSSGYSEIEFYRLFINFAYSIESEIQEIVNLTSKPLTKEEDLQKVLNLIGTAEDKIKLLQSSIKLGG